MKIYSRQSRVSIGGRLLLALAGIAISSLTLFAQQYTWYEPEIRWYGNQYHGRTTANGEIFNENALTFASNCYPFNTRLKISHNGKSISARCNDRGPKEIELSQGAFSKLEETKKGIIKNAIIQYTQN
jgi:rare lipoprotein A